MAISVLPLDALDPHAEMSLELEGRSFVVQWDWNARDKAWFISVFVDDEGRTPLVYGWRVNISGLPLLRSRSPHRPPGQIIFVANARPEEPPGRHDLGVRVLALYYDAQSLAELIG